MVQFIWHYEISIVVSFNSVEFCKGVSDLGGFIDDVLVLVVISMPRCE